VAREPLVVWLYGTKIAVLSEPSNRRLRLEFNQEAEERFRPQSVVLSASMPIDVSRRPNGVPVRVFFHGLLPEGEARVSISEEFGVTNGDDFGLLAAIGRDCAGAVVLQPEGERAPSTPTLESVLEPGDLQRAIEEIRERPLGAADDVRVSLAGAQDKLLLTQQSDGRWARPVGGTPSTHILKPQDMRFGGYAASEAFCLDLARQLGLTTVEATLVQIADRPTVIVSRYDRMATSDGIIRLHQEDALQALGRDASKYESDGGPSLRSVAKLLTTHARRADLVRLLELTTLNVVVGNADAHAKNLSILHPADGSIELAPAYDVTPTTFYTAIPTSRGVVAMSDTLGMKVNSKRSINEVTAADLIAEGRSWGMRQEEVEEAVMGTIESIGSLVGEAAKRWGIPDEMAEFVAARGSRLKAAGPAGPEQARGRRRPESRLDN